MRVLQNLAVLLFASCVCALSPHAHAHNFKVGDMVIDHPYATPTVAGQSVGAVYFRNLRNRGAAPDKLIAASTTVAARVGLHRMQMDGDVMRMREVPAIEVPAKTDIRMGHATPNGYHLMLEGLKAPLKDGDSFLLTLRFEKAGEREVQIHVQTPRQSEGHTHSH